MSILDKVAQVAPPSWDNTPLPNGKNYVLRTLGENSNEYNDVVLRILRTEHHSTVGIRKIERVQHPFAYGSFLLRKKQLELRSYGEIEPNDVFIKLDINKIPLALEYNLDVRRIGTFGAFLYSGSTTNCIIIAKCLKHSLNSIERDSEIYPEYVVYYT